MALFCWGAVTGLQIKPGPWFIWRPRGLFGRKGLGNGFPGGGGEKNFGGSTDISVRSRANGGKLRPGEIGSSRKKPFGVLTLWGSSVLGVGPQQISQNFFGFFWRDDTCSVVEDGPRAKFGGGHNEGYHEFFFRTPGGGKKKGGFSFIKKERAEP